jgi:hypothetical protein
MTESPCRLHHAAQHDLSRLTAIRSFASWLAGRSRWEPEKKNFMALAEKETKGECEANWLSRAEWVRRVSDGEGRKGDDG